MSSCFRIGFTTLLRSNVYSNYRRIHTTPAILAGHSKWQNIKHTKAAKDSQKSLLYNRLIYRIKTAIQKGGADPKLNREFANVVEICRKANMPNATIDRAVKRALEKKSIPMRLEVIGPENSLLIVDADVDNRNVFKNDVKKILKKYVGFGFATEGRCLAAFQEKGVVRVRNPNSDSNFDHEKMEEIAIEAEAEEVRVDDTDETVLMFIGDDTSFTRIRSHLEVSHPDEFVILEDGLEFVPFIRLDISEESMQVLANAIGEVGEVEGVNRIYTNI